MKVINEILNIMNIDLFDFFWILFLIIIVSIVIRITIKKKNIIKKMKLWQINKKEVYGSVVDVWLYLSSSDNKIHLISNPISNAKDMLGERSRWYFIVKFNDPIKNKTRSLRSDSYSIPGWYIESMKYSKAKEVLKNRVSTSLKLWDDIKVYISVDNSDYFYIEDKELLEKLWCKVMLFS